MGSSPGASITQGAMNTLMRLFEYPSQAIPHMSDSTLNNSTHDSRDLQLNGATQRSNNNRSKVTRPTPQDLIVTSKDLEEAAKCMRRTNVTLITRSLRTHFYCFDNLDVHKFEPSDDFIVNFISNGPNKCAGSVLRPVSILWPTNYDELVNQLAVLDAFLLNSEFRDRPVEWLVKRGLIVVPECKQCKKAMILQNDQGQIKWACRATQACANYCMPVLRPTFFASFEHVGLDKLLYAIYFWATCTPGDELYDQMELEPEALNGIWAKIQNICRATLEKTYPRFRLTNDIDLEADETNSNQPTQAQSRNPEPIDLISIKLNNLFVVCAKHPKSNLVRLGIHVPRISNYSYAELTQSWFASAAHIRVSESKFLCLRESRKDLKIDFVSRMEMISKNGEFDRNSAFGYLVSQLAHLFKDFDSASISCEQLKMILAEMQWREQYGTKPFESFVNIVSHMTQYGQTSLYYSEPDLGLGGSSLSNACSRSNNESDYIWAESYFYAQYVPKKYLTNGNSKTNRKDQNSNHIANPPAPDVRLTCHFCNQMLDNFEFCIHLIAHLERKRVIDHRPTEPEPQMIECKHCFKSYDRDQIAVHSALFRTNYHLVQYSCRICCIFLKDRANFLQHMRIMHFEHETPYHCPFCEFSASIQRDVLIHFHDKHKQQMVLLCPLCFREFTVAKPESMTKERMKYLSKMIYNHLSEHYLVSSSLTCSNCCLCFIDKKQLAVHRKLHHNPLRLRNESLGKIEPYFVAQDETQYCVRALAIELFIANKQPNAAEQQEDPSEGLTDNNGKGGKRPAKSPSISTSSSASSSSQDLSEDEQTDKVDKDLIRVRGLGLADKYLASGGPILSLGKPPPSTRENEVGSKLTSERLIELFASSSVSRSDGIIPNQSCIITNQGKPVRCGECFYHVGDDHFVSLITCKPCFYSTHCPRAAMKHNESNCHKRKSGIETTLPMVDN